MASNFAEGANEQLLRARAPLNSGPTDRPTDRQDHPHHQLGRRSRKMILYFVVVVFKADRHFCD